MFRCLSRCYNYKASFLIFLFTLFSLNGCSGEKPITIGYVGPQSAINGARLATEGIKIGGNPLRVVTVPSDQGLSLDDKALGFLLEQGAVAIIDATEHPLPSMPGGSAPLIIRASLTRDNLIAQENPVRVTAPFETTAPRIVDYLWDKGVVSVSIIVDYDDDVYTDGWLKTFRRRYERHQGVVLKVERTDSSSELSINTAVKKALKKKSSGLVVIAKAKSAVDICKLAKAVRSNLHIAFAETAFPQQLIEAGDPDTEGALASLLFDSKESKEFRSFEKKYNKKYSADPTFSEALIYDATNMAILAIQKRKGDKTLAETFAEISSHNGVLGKTERNNGVFRRKTSLVKITKEGYTAANKKQ